MRTVILVPRRAGVPERDEIWAWCRARWEQDFPELPIYEGHHDDGPFNRSAALNLAARLADEDGRWDQAVIIDADVLIDPASVRQAVARAAAAQRVVWAFGWWAGLTEAATQRVLAGDLDPDGLTNAMSGLFAAGKPNSLGHVPVPAVIPPEFDRINPVSWSCCFVVPRSAWDRLGGFDERFAGWGWEDMAFQSAVVGITGHERLGGAVIHLWHPRHPGLGLDGVNMRRNRQLGRRYMHALRVKGLHDRAEPASDEEMERDRLNLLRLMAREETTGQGRPSSDLPDWREWLPSLEELVESWKDRRPAGPLPRIAIVIRTGGQAENWTARSAYLRQTMASLTRHVEYQAVVARVIFSDWPEGLTPELEAIGAEHGFYVVGQAPVAGAHFTGSMERLWKYLGTRTWPYDYVLLVEDDFQFERPIDIRAMAGALESNQHLAQMALLRDACYAAEREKGGILGHPETEFTQVGSNGSSWLEHRRFFTLNPTLIPRRIIRMPWPRTQHSEAVFGRRLFDDPAIRSALWGRGEPWIRHLGEVRAGSGY